jgi:galactose oxidase
VLETLVGFAVCAVPTPTALHPAHTLLRFLPLFLSFVALKNHPNYEILSPPYLFGSDGTLASRPTIASAPSTFPAGGLVEVTVGESDPGATFALVRLGAVTHCINLDQRRVKLDVEGYDEPTATVFQVRIPSSSVEVPPGPYWLFVMSTDGVPSVGHPMTRAFP